MEKWYRTLVVFMAAAMVLCTAWMVYAGTEMLRANAALDSAENRTFQWSSGSYDISGRLKNGILEEFSIQFIPSESG